MTTTKSTAKKTTAKRATSKKAAKQPKAEQATTTTKGFVADVDGFIDETSDRVEDAIETAVRFARDAAHTYVGMGFVIRDRVSERKFELVDYRTFLDEAKVKGEAQLSEIQSKIEPISARFTQTVEPVAEFIESTLPHQVKDVIDSNRDRVRHLLDR